MMSPEEFREVEKELNEICKVLKVKTPEEALKKVEKLQKENADLEQTIKDLKERWQM